MQNEQINSSKKSPYQVRMPLDGGGIMANYQCTAACRHCLYGCSPGYAAGEYMTVAAMDKTFPLLRKAGCRSVHIGGGEPFIDFDGLVMLVEKLTAHGIRVDYIETNASWATDQETIVKCLGQLARAGADSLCISLDPYHAEYVPYEYPLRLAETCRKAGFGYFLWQDRFLRVLKDLDPSKNYSRQEIAAHIGEDYIIDTAKSYGIRMGGRGIMIEDEYHAKRPLAELLDSSTAGVGCRKPGGSAHFHIDMYGNYVPPGCTGIVVPLEDVVAGVPAGKYPGLEVLYTQGLRALYQLALREGFVPAEKYPSLCNLCFYVRKFLSSSGKYPEFDPEHYIESTDVSYA